MFSILVCSLSVLLLIFDIIIVYRHLVPFIFSHFCNWSRLISCTYICEIQPFCFIYSICPRKFSLMSHLRTCWSCNGEITKKFIFLHTQCALPLGSRSPSLCASHCASLSLSPASPLRANGNFLSDCFFLFTCVNTIGVVVMCGARVLWIMIWLKPYW